MGWSQVLQSLPGKPTTAYKEYVPFKSQVTSDMHSKREGF